jgi:DNA-binding beta-propeller fold protein YncE
MYYSRAFGVETDKQGNVYVADAGNSRICKVSSEGIAITIAGAASAQNFPIVGHSNGTGTSASFNHPKGVAVDAAGNVYVADTDNNLIRKITPAGVVTTVAGTGVNGSTDGDGTTATFNRPSGLTVNAAGTIIYVADTGNNLIRKIVIQ